MSATSFPDNLSRLSLVFLGTKSDGPAITPLRRDNVESLFLSNFIKGVAVHTGVLSRWLLPSLIRVISRPSFPTSSLTHPIFPLP
jgi:hypothetical protein